MYCLVRQCVSEYCDQWTRVSASARAILRAWSLNEPRAGNAYLASASGRWDELLEHDAREKPSSEPRGNLGPSIG